MALEVPQAFLTKDEHHRYQEPQDRLYRLPPNHLQDLRDVARGVEESDAGVCCSYLVDSMSGEGSDFDEHALNALERFAEQSMTIDFVTEMFGVPVVSHWRSRIQRCRRAIARLHAQGDSRSVSILFVAYGYPDPLAKQLPELEQLGPVLGSLARYTDAVEGKRLELVKQEAARLRAGWAGPSAMPGDDDGRWAAVFDLVHERDARARADRLIGSVDALRAALAPFAEPMPQPRWVPGARHETHTEVKLENPMQLEGRRAARKEREAHHKERKATFVSQVWIEALKMLSGAEKAYHEAWLRSATIGGHGRAKEPGALPRRRDVHAPPSRVRGSGWSST